MCCSDGTIWTAAGGFSDNFTRPSWQDDAVKQYLTVASATLPPSGMWNASNRASRAGWPPRGVYRACRRGLGSPIRAFDASLRLLCRRVCVPYSGGYPDVAALSDQVRAGLSVPLLAALRPPPHAHSFTHARTLVDG